MVGREHRLVTSACALLAILATACAHNETIEDHPCPPGGTELTYDDFGNGFLEAHCEGCHGQKEPDRNGAPDGVIFRTHDDVLTWKDRIFARAAGDNTTMPPGPDDPPADERAKLADWLACGAK